MLLSEQVRQIAEAKAKEAFGGEHIKEIQPPQAVLSFEGEAAWRIFVVWREGAPHASGAASLDFSHQLRKALIGLGDERFPYVMHVGEEELTESLP